MATVRIDKLEKSFKDTNVLSGIDLAIEDGELTVLVGPSGCGKSTLLRCLAGLETVSSGRIEIAGRDVTALPPKERDIAMVFQSYALYPHLSVEENIGFSLRLRGTAKAEIQRRVADAAELLGLSELLARYPRQLSGGQRQRVAMGRAIVRSPSVFLFDEPLSNLDAAMRVQMRTELAQLHQRLNATMVYVTHDQVEAMTLADRVVVLNAGVVQQAGPPLELYRKPANVFVARFFGSPPMNIFSGATLQPDGTLTDGEALGLPNKLPRKVAQATPVLVGLRPEHCILRPSGEGKIKARVSVVEPMGHETLVHLSAAPHAAICRLPTDDNNVFAPGQHVDLDYQPQDLHVFEQGTERAIP